MSSIYTDPTSVPKDNVVTTVATDEKMRLKMQSKRKLVNTVALTLSLAAMAFGLFWLIWILYTTVTLGVSGLSAQLFTEMTPPPNSEGGGLANAITGTLLMVGFATLFATPLGILAGVQLAESRKDNKLAISVRFFNDILLSAPSIVIGLFVSTSIGGWVHDLIDDWLAKLAPGYKTIREVVSQLLGGEGNTSLLKGEVCRAYIMGRAAGVSVTAIVTAKHANGDLTVYAPTAPIPTSGFVYHLSADCVDMLPHVSVEEAMRTVIACGSGSQVISQLPEQAG